MVVLGSKFMNIDTQKQIITLPDGKQVPLFSKEGFRLVSEVWLQVGWDQKHLYGFTWLGRPIIQIPDDMVRLQEVIYRLQPDVIIETGIAHGGSLIFYASLCKAMDHGRVVGVDIEIRPHNKKAMEEHFLASYITMIEGSSIAPDIVAEVKKHIPDGATTLIILDSNHTHEHVLAELRAYGPLVSVGSYIVATDGSMEFLGETPRAQKQYPKVKDWNWDNPKKAAIDFVAENHDFVIEEPPFPFNEGAIDFRVTHWPSAYVKRVR